MKKTITCDELRDRLTEDAAVRQEPVAAGHLEECAACRGYAERLTLARQALRDHHGNVEPDAGFSARVLARIPDGPTQVLGWAAVRLLPATLALALVLAWFAFQEVPQTTTTTTAEAPAPTEDLLSWVIDPTGEAQ